MFNVHALILGLIEGATEFLPISSTAHLILGSQLLKIVDSSQFLKLFEVFIQSGAILAVAIIYFKFILNHKSLLLNLFISFLPTAAVGFFFYKMVKNYFFESNSLIIAMLIIGGIIFIALEFLLKRGFILLDKKITNMTYKQAFVIGLLQSIAIVPGVSRAGIVIVTMMLIGFKREEAAIYSFLIAIPTIFAASAFDFYKTGTEIIFLGNNLQHLAIGFVTSFASAVLATVWFINYLKKNSLIVFGVYRILFGLLAFYLLLHP